VESGGLGMSDLFTVKRVGGGYAVLNWRGEVEIAYRQKKHAESYAVGAFWSIYGEATRENHRRDGIRAYLSARAKRAPNPQLKMEF
jgi:hypothetical protein